MIDKIKPVILLVVIIWAVFLIEFTFNLSFSKFGIIPRILIGLRGIVLAPFIHANIYHLSSNTMPLLVLGSISFLFYSENAFKVLIWSIVLSGIGVWIFGRSATHIGISGVIYALASFVIFAGFYKRKFLSVIISLAIIFVYGGLIWGLFPGKFYISYEAHISGAVSGFLLARIYYRKKK